MSDLLRRLLPFAIILIVSFSAVYVLENVFYCNEDNPVCLSLPPALITITDEIGNVTHVLSKNTEAAADKLSQIGTENMGDVLNNTYSDTVYAVSYGFMSPEGILEAVAPPEYADSVGLEIGKFEPAKSILEGEAPVMTDAFTAIEGFSAVEISYPVKKAGGGYAGAVMCLAEPAEFLGNIISPFEEEEGVSVTVMQTDGYILYDKDLAQVGKNLFTDPFFSQYTSLVNLGHKISSKETGYGTYTFYDTSSESKKPVKKQAHWDTVNTLGKEWRIILFKTTVSYV